MFPEFVWQIYCILINMGIFIYLTSNFYELVLVAESDGRTYKLKGPGILASKVVFRVKL